MKNSQSDWYQFSLVFWKPRLYISAWWPHIMTDIVACPLKTGRVLSEKTPVTGLRHCEQTQFNRDRLLRGQYEPAGLRVRRIGRITGFRWMVGWRPLRPYYNIYTSSARISVSRHEQMHCAFSWELKGMKTQTVYAVSSRMKDVFS
jgi:hypothetical protein